MRLYLDDLRLPPKRDAQGNSLHWDFHCRTTTEAINTLKENKVTFISFDYDLGPDDLNGNTVALWIEDQARDNPAYPPLQWTVHSNNSDGRARITETMHSAESYWRTRDQAI